MFSRLTTVLTLLTFCTVFFGCNSGGGHQSTITITPRPQSVAAGAQMSFSATLAEQNAAQSLGIGWTVAPYVGEVGTLSQSTSSASQGSAVTYTAPATPPAPNSVTVTAYSIADRTVLDSVTFAITGSALPVVQNTTLPPGTVGTDYPATDLQATGGTAPYTWSITSGVLPTGMTLTNATLAGIPGSAGTFPITFQVTDSNSNSVEAKLILTVSFQTTGTCGSPIGKESALNGQYAFLLHGYDDSGPTAIVGSFTADGTGNIAAGQEDVNINNGASPQSYSVVTETSNYTLDSDNRGCLTMTTSAGTFLYRFSAVLDSSGNADHGYLISFDSPGARVGGTFHKQDATAFSVDGISGSYTFGVDSAVKKGRYAAVGSFAASSGVLSAGAMDMNLTGNVNEAGVPTLLMPAIYPETPIPFTGTYTVASSGRGTIVFNLPDQVINGVFYVVSATELYLIRSDPQSSPLFAGHVLRQSGAPFTQASLSGIDVRYFGGTATAGGGAKEGLGLLTISAPGSFSYSDTFNDGGNYNPYTSSDFGSGNYTIDPSSGRLNLSADIAYVPVCYLSAPNQAFCMSTDIYVSVGEILPQVAGPFSDSSLSGKFAFGTVQHPSLSGNLQTGESSITTPESLNALVDLNGAGSVLTLGTVTPFSYQINSNGAGALLPAQGSNNSLFYLVSPQLWVGIDLTGTDPTLTFYEQ